MAILIPAAVITAIITAVIAAIIAPVIAPVIPAIVAPFVAAAEILRIRGPGERARQRYRGRGRESETLQHDFTPSKRETRAASLGVEHRAAALIGD
jgi:hypothetical protein